MRVRRVLAAAGLGAALAVGATATTASAATPSQSWAAAGTTQEAGYAGAIATPVPDMERLYFVAAQNVANLV